MLRIAMDCSSITDFQQSTAIRIAKKFRNLHIENLIKACTVDNSIGKKKENIEKTNLSLLKSYPHIYASF